MGKSITIQKIHSILRRAGFQKSTRHTTGIRGWYTYTYGYSLSPVRVPKEQIPYNPSRRRMSNMFEPVKEVRLSHTETGRVEAMVKALQDAGLSCYEKSGDWYASLEADQKD